MRRLNPACSRSMAFVVRALLYCEGGGRTKVKTWYEQASKYVLIILKTARAFSLSSPQSLLARADSKRLLHLLTTATDPQSSLRHCRTSEYVRNSRRYA